VQLLLIHVRRISGGVQLTQAGAVLADPRDAWRERQERVRKLARALGLNEGCR
jgi:hypothetical protein